MKNVERRAVMYARTATGCYRGPVRTHGTLFRNARSIYGYDRSHESIESSSRYATRVIALVERRATGEKNK